MDDVVYGQPVPNEKVKISLKYANFHLIYLNLYKRIKVSRGDCRYWKLHVKGYTKLVKKSTVSITRNLLERTGSILMDHWSVMSPLSFSAIWKQVIFILNELNFKKF